MTTIPVERELLADLLSLDREKRIPAERHLYALLAEQPQAGAGQTGAAEHEAFAAWFDEVIRPRVSYGNPDSLKKNHLPAFQAGATWQRTQPPARHDQGDEVRRLREALEPFAALAKLFDDGVRGGTMPKTGAVMSWPRLDEAGELVDNELTVEHLRSARAALTRSPKGEEE